MLACDLLFYIATCWVGVVRGAIDCVVVVCTGSGEQNGVANGSRVKNEESLPVRNEFELSAMLLL